MRVFGFDCGDHAFRHGKRLSGFCGDEVVVFTDVISEMGELPLLVRIAVADFPITIDKGGEIGIRIA